MTLGITAPFVDPFSEIQARLEEILREDIDMSASIEPGNQVDDGQPKTITAPADYGEWRVLPFLGGGADLRATSSSSTVVQNFEIGVATDNEDVKMMAFPLKWMVIRALVRALANDQGGRLVLGLPYVQDVRILDLTETATDDKYNRGIPGWASVVIVGIKMVFKTKDLIEAPGGVLP
jgi:hypothetical protein